jgi:hypothetical protein
MAKAFSTQRRRAVTTPRGQNHSLGEGGKSEKKKEKKKEKQKKRKPLTTALFPENQSTRQSFPVG